LALVWGEGLKTCPVKVGAKAKAVPPNKMRPRKTIPATKALGMVRAGKEVKVAKAAIAGLAEVAREARVVMGQVEEEKAEPVAEDPLRTGLRENPGRRDEASHGLHLELEAFSQSPLLAIRVS
jgi:hypothetical protein